MNYEDLAVLLDFHYWARDRMLEALEPLSAEQFTRELTSSFTSIRDTAVHIYGADSVWYARWRGNSPGSRVSPDAFPDPAALRSAWKDLENNVRAFVRELGPEGIGRRMDYAMFDGRRRSSPFWQMLQHVVNHGSYHRGQVTTMLRQIGAAPPQSTDLITFYREREAKAASL